MAGVTKLASAKDIHPLSDEEIEKAVVKPLANLATPHFRCQTHHGVSAVEVPMNVL